MYEFKLKYLSYGYTSDKVVVPLRLRERHLTEDTRNVVVQGIGYQLQASIRSDRDEIALRLPLSDWVTTKPYQYTLHGNSGGILNVGRFQDVIENDGDSVTAEIHLWNTTETKRKSRSTVPSE